MEEDCGEMLVLRPLAAERSDPRSRGEGERLATGGAGTRPQDTFLACVDQAAMRGSLAHTRPRTQCHRLSSLSAGGP